MTRILITLISVLSLTPALPGIAFSDEDGGTRSVFAEGAGNRGLALGGAYSALATDASAPVWNPGGLGFVERAELQASYSSLYGLGFGEQYASVVLPSWRWGVGAVTIRHLGVGGIEGRDNRNVLLDSDLSDSETEIALSYGRMLGPAWSMGGSLKLQRQSLAGLSASGIGADLGVLVNPGLALARPEEWMHRMRVGLSLRNLVEPSLRLDQESVPDPATARFGMAYLHPFGPGRQLQAAVDLERVSDMSLRLHTGVEFRIHPMVAVRAGLNKGHLTAGSGVSWKEYSLEYVFEDNGLGNVHRFGLALGFGATVEENRLASLRREEDALQERLAGEFERRQAARVAGLLTEAENAGEAGEIDEALDILGIASTLAPDSKRIQEMESQLLHQKGNALERNGDFAEAAIVFNRILALNPDDPIAGRSVFRCKAASAERTARSASLRKRFETSLDAFSRGDLATARSGFQSILAEEAEDTESRNMLRRTEEAIALRVGDLLDQTRRFIDAEFFTDAEGTLQQARSLDAQARGIGTIERRLAEARQAATQRRQVAATPTPTRTKPGAKPKKPKPAQHTLTAQQRKEIEDLYQKGLKAMEESRADDAMRYLELVFSSAPNHKQVREYLKREYLMRGMDAFAVGKLDAAVSNWENALRVDPKDQKSRGYLDRARKQLNRSREILGSDDK